jgi:hypothetical protein
MSGDGHPNGNAEALAFWEHRTDGAASDWDPIYGRPGEAADLLRKWKAEADAEIAEAARLQAEAERLQAAYDLDHNAREWAKRTKGTERSGLQ